MSSIFYLLNLPTLRVLNVNKVEKSTSIFQWSAFFFFRLWLVSESYSCTALMILYSIHSRGKFSRRQIYGTLLFSPENKLWHFMQFVFLGWDNMYEMSNLISRGKYFKLSSAEIIPSMLSISSTAFEVQPIHFLFICVFYNTAVFYNTPLSRAVS